jgi:hypothetical protein
LPASQTSQPAPASQISQPAPASQPASSSQASQPTLPLASSQPEPLSQSSQASSPPQPSPAAPPQYSPNTLYNLANSYARAGKAGLAVLNYERAALLAPYDADIAANLAYVRTSAHVPGEPQSRFTRIAQFASPTLAALLGIVGIALVGAVLLATKRAAPRFRLARATGLALGIALIGLTVSNAMSLWPRLHAAIILVNQTPALVSPVPMADTAFVLPEAETVQMVAKHEDFILVRTRSGLSGWVSRGNVEAVVP